MTREPISVTRTTVVNTETMCQRLGKLAAMGLAGPIMRVLNIDRHRSNAVVQVLATQSEITLLSLPSYSPNLNLMERPWRLIKRGVLYGREYPRLADFQAALRRTLDGLSRIHAVQLKTPMTLRFQTFEDVSLRAA